MTVKKVVVLGGTGFVGKHVIAALNNQGIACRILARRIHRHTDLLASGIGNELIEADIFDSQSLLENIQGTDAAINLVGILNENKKNSFRRVHIELVDLLVDTARRAGVKRILHMSALNADEGGGSSLYLRSKGEGENHLFTKSRPDIAATSFRPSVIFGEDDSFLNRFSGLLNIPGPLPLACYDARFAPVYVGDVAQAFAGAINDKATYGQSFELCGPQTFTLEQIVRYILATSGRYKNILRLGPRASLLQATMLGALPGKLFTVDNYQSMKKDSVCTNNGFARLGMEATAMDAVVPYY